MKVKEQPLRVQEINVNLENIDDEENSVLREILWMWCELLITETNI